MLVWIVGLVVAMDGGGVVEKKCACLEEWWKQSGMVMLWRSHPHQQQGKLIGRDVGMMVVGHIGDW